MSNPKISSLLNYEKIKDVIDIDALSDKKSMVESYVITPGMEEHLASLFKNIDESTHKAAQIIGGYGSGKSHLLAFIISVLTDQELRERIQSEAVRAAAAALNRDFAVVFWELQPNDVDLSEYFYDNLETQLEENYGIKLELPETRVVDHKKNILSILEQVKADNPTRGLMVIVDEVSDFLKIKTKEKINRDVQFMRILGQAAQACDFMFIGAMQEHVFSNPKYVDEAESFGRVSERFEIITIKREDVKRVISRRVLGKTAAQRLELESLFDSYLHYFPNLRSNLQEYIDLFPLHPYVIQIFSELPYFEKRGIIQFTVDEVEKILDREFPNLVTYDLIFDEIVSKHTVKNLEAVAPVVNAVQTLETKVDLLDTRHQDTARSLIKALAVLKLYGKSANNGATVEELANTLLIMPQNKLVEANDEIALVMDKLRRVTDGQFINHSKDGYYYLDLGLTIDYDQVIERKAENLPESALDDEILAILKDQLALPDDDTGHRFADSCRWSARRSFRDGCFIYETGKGEKAAPLGDYQLVFLSPFCAGNRYTASESCLIFSGSLQQQEGAVHTLKKAAAANLLARENYSRTIMEKKYIELKRAFIELMVKAYLETGKVDNGSQPKTVKALISREFSNFDELFAEVKPSLFEDFFTRRYPKHPRFTQQITRDNIKGELSAALRETIGKNGVQALFANARSVLNALELVDDSGNLSTGKSEVARQILQAAREAQGANLDVKEILDRYAGSPYGYDPLMTAFVIVILTFNGEITLRVAGGKVITSSEVQEVFGAGLDAFESVRYLSIEEGPSPEQLIKLFTALGVSPDVSARLRVTGKRGEAVQALRTRYLELKEQLAFARARLESLFLHHSGLLDIEWLQERHRELAEIPVDDLDKVKTPHDLKKIIYPDDRIEAIGLAYRLLQQLHGFYEYFFEKISAELEYAREVRRVLEEHPGIFQVAGVKELLEESFAALADTGKLVESGELYPLLGKLQQVKQKYVTAYYKAHQRCVGDEADWSRLAELSQSPAYRSLQLLKHVTLLNKYPFTKLESELSALGTLRCTGFQLELLQNKVTCPRCHFPAGFKGKSVDARISDLEDQVEAIYREWEASVLAELKNYQANLQYLDPEEAALIQAVLQQGKLEGLVTESLVIALNNLFKELDLVELDPEKLAGHLFAGGQVMDYYTFERRLEEYKQLLTAGRDLDKVRIKRISIEDKM